MAPKFPQLLLFFGRLSLETFSLPSAPFEVDSGALSSSNLQGADFSARSISYGQRRFHGKLFVSKHLGSFRSDDSKNGTKIVEILMV